VSLLSLESIEASIDQSIADLVVDELVLNEGIDRPDSLSAAEVILNNLSSGLLSEEAIADILAKSFGLQRATAEMYGNQIELTARGILNDELAPLGIKPIAIDQGVLCVGVADPSKISIVPKLRSKYQLPIDVFVITLSELVGGSIGVRSMQKDMVDYIDIDENEESQSAVVKYVQDLIRTAIQQHVSDIHIEAYRDFAQVRYRIDGALILQEERIIGGTSASATGNFLHANYRAVIARIKILSGLDISERRLPQDGAIFFKVGARGGVDIRVSVLPSQFGERVVMRILDKSAVNLDIQGLGIPQKALDVMLNAIQAPQGLVLVTGPTGSGKTTTQYSALKYINRPDVNILTVEDPIEYNLEGVSQVQINDDIGLTFSAALRSFLRQDPEVILVGEIRDLDTVDIALKAALTGHLVLSTIHTNSAASTINRLVNMGVPAYLIAGAATCIVAQRLARRLCEQCAVDHDPGDPIYAGIKDKLPDPESFKPRVADGCPACGGRGVKGRVGLYEAMHVSRQIQEGILDGLSEIDLLAIAKKEGFETLQDHALKLVGEGVISLTEYNRVVMG